MTDSTSHKHHKKDSHLFRPLYELELSYGARLPIPSISYLWVKRLIISISTSVYPAGMAQRGSLGSIPSPYYNQVMYCSGENISDLNIALIASCTIMLYLPVKYETITEFTLTYHRVQKTIRYLKLPENILRHIILGYRIYHIKLVPL